LEWDAGYVYDLVEMVELDPDDVQPPRERRLLPVNIRSGVYFMP